MFCFSGPWTGNSRFSQGSFWGSEMPFKDQVSFPGMSQRVFDHQEVLRGFGAFAPTSVFFAQVSVRSFHQIAKMRAMMLGLVRSSLSFQTWKWHRAGHDILILLNRTLKNYQCSTEGEKFHKNLAPVLVIISENSLVFFWKIITSIGLDGSSSALVTGF